MNRLKIFSEAYEYKPHSASDIDTKPNPDTLTKPRFGRSNFNQDQKSTIKSFENRTPGMKYIGHEKDTGHAIMKDDDDNYIRIDSMGDSKVHFKD